MPTTYRTLGDSDIGLDRTSPGPKIDRWRAFGWETHQSSQRCLKREPQLLPELKWSVARIAQRVNQAPDCYYDREEPWNRADQGNSLQDPMRTSLYSNVRIVR